MKNLPIDMLRSFVVVNDEASFTLAAEKLGRTQPAISLQIKKLEQLLERPLINRVGQKIALTAAGQTLLHYAQQILALNDEVLGQFANPLVSGRIRLGIPSEFATTLLPKIVGRFAKTYPDVTLDISCDLSRNLLSDEQRKQYDLILALYDKVGSLPKRLQQGLIKTDPLVWVGSPVSKAHLQETLPLVAAPSGCIYRQRALRQLGLAKRSCRIVYNISDLTGIQAAIDEGLGVTVLAKSTVPEGLNILEPSEYLPQLGEVGIGLTQHEHEANPAVQLLADYIKSGLLR